MKKFCKVISLLVYSFVSLNSVCLAHDGTNSVSLHVEQSNDSKNGSRDLPQNKIEDTHKKQEVLTKETNVESLNYIDPDRKPWYKYWFLRGVRKVFQNDIVVGAIAVAAVGIILYTALDIYVSLCYLSRS